MVVQTAAAVRPPERLTVSEAAEKYRKLNNPGAYIGPWRNSTTPYLVEPQDVLTSLDFRSMCFVGPSQSGKTDMALNYQLHSVLCDPADMMLIQTSHTTARDFSIRRVNRLHRHTPILAEKLHADNTFDKQYLSGMLYTLSWPTINELSGKPIPRLWLTDYDRMDQDVDGEGTPFDLAVARTRTFREYGMTGVESSPGFVVDDPKFIAETPHEAPPTQGILSIYNRGDRRRWYWRCVSCKNPFEPDFSLVVYPDSADLMESAEQARMRCPHCEAIYPHDPGGSLPGKAEMNQTARWVKDGMFWLPDGTMQGTPRRSTTASFWLKGVAATFSDWKGLVFNFLSAEKEYEKNGQEEALKTTVNTDQGMPYRPKAASLARSPEELRARAKNYGQRVVAPGVRFLVAAVDVQKNRFVVQVHGVGVGGDIWVIDRFDIKKSKRLDDDGERYWVNPAAYEEDWKLLAEEVIEKTYPLHNDPDQHMAVKFTVCDSGGRDGVTEKAYNFYRWLRYGDVEITEDGEVLDLEPDEVGTYRWTPGLAARFQLLKGASSKNAPRIQLTYPDSQRKDRHAGARGEIPVLMIHPSMMKDAVNNRLDRKDPMGGRINFPNWLDDNFYTELTVEVKDPKKGWINPRQYRNESWDLLAYCEAATLTAGIRLEHIVWNSPPDWAEEWDKNSLVFRIHDQGKPFEAETKKRPSLAELADRLA